jgi:hypothetical protein
MRDRFYLRSAHGDVGLNFVWHRHNKSGYHTDLNQAQVFTLAEAQSEWNRGICQPISADHVDALAVWKVDCQALPSGSVFDDSDAYVLFERGRWSGNDVYWLNADTHATFLDFSLASSFTRKRAEGMLLHNQNFIAVPYAHAQKVRRRVFEAKSFNARIMVQGAGLRMPECVKRSKRRVNDRDRKERFNCPECGKISWQYNPYDFEGCKYCADNAVCED